MKKTFSLILAGILSAFILITRGGASQASASQPTVTEVNVYTARHYPEVDDSIYQAFTSKTGIKVNIIKAKAEELLQRIKTEGANSKADVYFTVDAGNLYLAKESGILQPIKSPVLKRNVPANYRDKDNMWVGLTMRARVLVYAKDRVKPAQLSTYEDLANPKWKGKILVRSSKL